MEPMDKPQKPTNLLPSSFGGIKENFAEDRIKTGYEPDVPQIIEGENLNYLLDGIGSNFEYNNKISDFIKDMPINHLPTVDENNKLVYKNIVDVGGGGVEVCDIGISLFVDETKGLRRYLNGQIVAINANTQGFLDRLLKIKALYPSLFTTEENWQAEKVLSHFGQVGKFVLNYASDGVTVENVRLPAIVNIQGLFDLQNLGMTVQAGLPNVKGSFQAYGIEPNRVTSGAMYETQESGSELGHHISPALPIPTINIDLSHYNSIYGDSNKTVQVESIQYPYFIQIATGQETKAIVNNLLETNIPYVLGQSQYIRYKLSDIEQENMSLLISLEQENPKKIYSGVYDWVLKNANKGVEGFKFFDDPTATDYDFKINTEKEIFILPLLNGEEDLPDYSVEPETITQNWVQGTEYVAKKNGWFRVSTNCTGSGQWINYYIDGKFICNNLGVKDGDTTTDLIKVKKGDKLTITTNYGGSKNEIIFYPAKGNGYLYYYVGATVQNAPLINAGALAEGLANKVDINSKVIDGQWVYKKTEIFNNRNIGTYTVDLSKVLPNDDCDYELIVRVYLSSTNSGIIHILVNNNYLFSAILSSAGFQYYHGLIPVKERTLTVKTNNTFTADCAVELFAYRRIGTNK